MIRNVQNVRFGCIPLNTEVAGFGDPQRRHPGVINVRIARASGRIDISVVGPHNADIVVEICDDVGCTLALQGRIIIDPVDGGEGLPLIKGNGSPYVRIESLVVFERYPE